MSSNVAARKGPTRADNYPTLLQEGSGPPADDTYARARKQGWVDGCSRRARPVG
ncbi:MAG: hypothetical protein ABUS56_12910 [Acidobacteriota bacterium]